MTPEEQLTALATLMADMKHVVRSIDDLADQVRAMITRSEFDALKKQVEEYSAKALMAKITQVATTITSVAAAAFVILAMLGHIKIGA